MVKNVLMLSYHFPPAAVGSGHLRTLGFARHLPVFGWRPTVLSATTTAFPQINAANNVLIPDGCAVYRAFALDARRHFGIAGKYPGFLAKPDRWISWWPAGVWQGLRLIRRRQIDVIWSTYPIMTAHCIAYTLHRLTGLPWVADFRDPVASSISGANSASTSSQMHWEQRALAGATRIVCTTPGAFRHYAESYPKAEAEGRLAVIANGYDEAAFANLPQSSPSPDGKPLVLVHSGILYRDGRDPLPFFEALAKLKAVGIASADRIRIVLRASGFEAVYAEALRRLGLADVVELAPPISNLEALEEQAAADALLLFQGSKYDRHIPAKVYEYLRIGRPIFALVGANGDTAALLRKTGGAELVAMDDIAAIEKKLRGFIERLRAGTARCAAPNVVRAYSRYQSTALLADLFDRTVVG